MKVGQKVYTVYKGNVKTGVIVSKMWHWDNILPHREYIVRHTKDLGRDGIAGVLAAAFNGTPDSLEMHTRNSLYHYYEAPQPVQDEAEGDES